MEMIISIGSFRELDIYNVYSNKLDSKPDFSLLFEYSCCFFLFCKTFLFQIRIYFFLPLSSQERDPFLFASSKEKKETSKKRGILRHLYISFSFFPFLINVSIFLYGCFERKILFLWERDLSLLKSWKIRIQK